MIAHLVDITEDDFSDGVVLQDFVNDSSITTSNDKDPFGVRMTRQRWVHNHLLVAGKQE